MTKSLAALVLVAVSVWATGCGASIGMAPGEGAASNQVLTSDATGWVDKSATGTTGIQGQWHAFGDGRFGVAAVTAESCQTSKFGECSIVHDPAPGLPFAPTPGLGMCTSGVIARWIAGSDGLTPDGSSGWAGIVLELNMPDWPEPRTSANVPTGQLYDAEAHGVTGFAFDIDSEPAPGARLMVQVATVEKSLPDSKPAYWGGAHLDGSPIHAGHNEFRWSDVGPTPFDPTHMLRIGFLVSGSDTHAVSYNFCINHLTALRSTIDAPSNGDTAPRLTSDDQLLVPDENGWVARSKTGKTNIQGWWFAAADGFAPKGDVPNCQAAGHGDTECSRFSEPDPAVGGFPPTKDLGMCTSGVVAKSGDDPGRIWGGMIGLGLNVTDFPEGAAKSYNAELNGVTGFAFDIDSEPSGGGEIRVDLVTDSFSAASWGGGDGAKWSPVHAGHNEFKWADVGGPWWLVPNAPPFDPRRLMTIGFHVPSNPDYAVSYRFCVNNLTALRH